MNMDMTTIEEKINMKLMQQMDTNKKKLEKKEQSVQLMNMNMKKVIEKKINMKLGKSKYGKKDG